MTMTRTFSRIIITLIAVVSLAACYGINEENFPELAPISFNEVSDVIDIPLGEELVYDKLVVTSDKPVSYEWSYGPRKPEGKEFEMSECTVISNEPAIKYTFRRLGSYILRLKADNGESIVFKYFTLNVNSGMDEGLLLLNTDAEGNSCLSFIKTVNSSAPEQGQSADEEQTFYEDVISYINPDQSIKNGTDLYMNVHEADDIQYASLLVSTKDENSTIYKLDPKTFTIYNKIPMKAQFDACCSEFVGDVATGSSAYYAFMVGSDGHTYRYDLFGDFVGERSDATKAGLVTGGYMDIYYSSATATSANRKPVLYSEEKLFQPGNGKVTERSLSGYKVVNMCGAATTNKLYVLFESTANPGTYCIKSTTGSLGSFKNVVADFTAEDLQMDKNSIMVNTKKSSDVYYSYNNKIYRWSLTSAPPASAKITLPAGEIIKDMATNFMGDFNNGNEETLLYVATYNPDRAGEKKGSIYVYRFEDDSLVQSYEGKFDEPVKLLYKYRIS